MSMSQEDVAIKYGWRSGLEEVIDKQLRESGKKFSYEPKPPIPYVQPAKNRKYTPDFVLTKKDGSVLVIETKGRLTLEDRNKHLYIKATYPDIDIRFVFSNIRAKIYKGANTTHGQWATGLGYKCAHKTIPEDWLDECI